MVRIAITMGDPKGIGPEVIAKSWRVLPFELRSNLRVYGDRAVLDAAAKMVGTEFDPKQIVITSSITGPVGSISDPDASRIALQALDAAITDVKKGLVKGIVTAPVNKYRMQLTEPKFVGHTERLAKVFQVKDIVMMFACPNLRISLVTSHLALKDVPAHITKQRILITIHLTIDALKKYFGCKEPRIAVLNLNPHAGENGALGSEENESIIPAIEKARKEGIICFGPISAETVFSRLKNIDFDAIVAMYHDQGLAPMRIICPEKSVNITLGLPFVRTSPGHGTAEDIAWRNQASEAGMIAAIEMAAQLTT